MFIPDSDSFAGLTLSRIHLSNAASLGLSVVPTVYISVVTGL